jgi:hypothetical protein
MMILWNPPNKIPKKKGYYIGLYQSVSGKIAEDECYYKGKDEGWYADECNKISNAWTLVAWKKGDHEQRKS